MVSSVNIFTRLFAYPILERELSARIADRDAEIVHLRIEVQELRDRLFLKSGLLPSGQSASASMGAVVPAYRTGRQRLRDMVTPPLVSETELTAEEQRQIDDHLTQ